MLSVALHPHELAALGAVRLSQIRRPVVCDPVGDNGGELREIAPTTLPISKGWDARYDLDNPKYLGESPLGAPGSQLRVLEEWWSEDEDGCHYKAEEYPESWWERVGDRCLPSPGMVGKKSWAPDWQPASTLPEWASRHFLEVIATRPERLHSYTEQDAIDMGCPREYLASKNWLQPTWDSAHPEFPYAGNPWVWVAEVKEV